MCIKVLNRVYIWPYVHSNYFYGAFLLLPLNKLEKTTAMVSGELFRPTKLKPYIPTYNWFLQDWWHVVTMKKKKDVLLLLMTNIYSLILIASDQLNSLHIVMHLLIVILLLISELISDLASLLSHLYVGVSWKLHWLWC